MYVCVSVCAHTSIQTNTNKCFPLLFSKKFGNQFTLCLEYIFCEVGTIFFPNKFMLTSILI